jgi:hypothetical protein
MPLIQQHLRRLRRRKLRKKQYRPRQKKHCRLKR